MRKHTPSSSQPEFSFDPDSYFPDNLDAYAPWVARHGLRYPYGECQCGCGQKTKLAANINYGNQVGQPRRFVLGHATKPPGPEANFKPVPGEIWRDIPGYDGKYQASDQGRIRSYAYGYWKILKTRLVNNRREYVTLTHNGKPQTRILHRLVLEAFVGPCPDGMEACHNDGDSLNNRINNLRWDTHSRNQLDKRRHGTTTGKLTIEDARAIRKAARKGESQTNIAHRYGVHPSHINKIVSGRKLREAR